MPSGSGATQHPGGSANCCLSPVPCKNQHSLKTHATTLRRRCHGRCCHFQMALWQVLPFPPSIPPFSHQAWEICLAGIQGRRKTTEQPETLDRMKPGPSHPQQGGVLENTTFVKPEREVNTEPGTGNEICMYLGPHPAPSSHCTSCLCIQGWLDPIQKRCRGTNVALATPSRQGGTKRTPRLNLFPFLILIYTHHPLAGKRLLSCIDLHCYGSLK